MMERTCWSCKHLLSKVGVLPPVFCKAFPTGSGIPFEILSGTRWHDHLFGDETVFYEAKEKPKLRLIGEDGNAFNLLGLARRAATKAGWPNERWEVVRDRAIESGYDNLLAVLQDEFDVE